MTHPQDPERDVGLARQALAEGDLPHAIHHIGAALASDPTRADWLGVLNEIIGRSPDPLGLVPIADGVDFVTAAIRAWIQASAGNYPDALSLLGGVAKTRPDVPFLSWAVWWLGREGVMQQLGFDAFMGALGAPIMRMAFGCPSPLADDDPRRASVQAGLDLFERGRTAFPTEPVVFYGASICCRRLGRLDDALPLAQHALALEPSWRNCVAVAQVYREMNAVDDAVAMFRAASEHDPSDASAHVDIGDILTDAERYDEALAAYQRALEVDPDKLWATASIEYLRYRQTGDPRHRRALLALKGRDDRAAELYGRIEHNRPYINALPRGADASCNAMRDIFERMYQNPAQHHGSVVRLRLSHPESPSVLAAFWLQMEMWGTQVELHYEVETVQQPDPRQPRTQVEVQLWSWDGGQPRPLPARPDPTVAQAVFELCEEPFHIDDVWGPRAAEIARRLGPGAIDSLLGVMVHPPRPPDSSYRVLMWVQRVQVAAAMIIAQLDAGWRGSVRQRVLYSLVYGPVDWSVDAAIIALGYLARRDPAIKADVISIFQWLSSQIPTEGFTCFEYPLASTWLELCDEGTAEHQRIVDWLVKIVRNETQTGSRVRAVEIGPKPFDQQAEMARAQAAAAELAAGGGGDPDPPVFPGQPVARLSDYVRLMRAMQTGDMNGALGQFGLDMMSYGTVAAAWGQKLAADPILSARFSQMMMT